MNLEIAHIIGLNPTSARHVAGMPPDELNSFRNLILLCHPHHKHVDGKHTRANYETEKLRRWKAEVEVSGQDVLNAYVFQDEEQLEQNMVVAMYEEVKSVHNAVAELAKQNSEGAAVFKRLLERVEGYQLIGNYVDADQVSMLTEAGRNLRRYLNPDVVMMLRTAASDLQHVNSDLVVELKSAARDLRRSQGLR